MALGTTEIGLILLAAVVLFGAPSVVKWAKALREAKQEFNKPDEEEAK